MASAGLRARAPARSVATNTQRAPGARACRRVACRVAETVRDPPPAIVIDEGESDVNGTISIQQVPTHPDVPGMLHGSRLLYLGDPEDGAKLLSVYKPLGSADPFTYAYWDFFATLPSLLQPGPVGIYGFGGGTAARLMLELYDTPPLILGWDIDPQVLTLCARAFGHQELTDTGGVLIYEGDALAEGVGEVEGGFAGIVVDLFKGGEMAPELMHVDTWRRIRGRLAEGGRVMAHLGPASDPDTGKLSPAPVLALNAMHEAFDGVVSYVDPPEGSGLDVMAVTGPLPTPKRWAKAMGPHFKQFTSCWDAWVLSPIKGVPAALLGDEGGGRDGGQPRPRGRIFDVPAGGRAAGGRGAPMRPAGRGSLFRRQPPAAVQRW